jgi:ferredoxin
MPEPIYHIDENCIDCDLCHETSPEMFARDEELGRSYVVRPPADDEELALYREAAEACPVEAIREDD